MTLDYGTLESGRKLGIISSLITVVSPLVSLFTFLIIMFSQIAFPRVDYPILGTPVLIALFSIFGVISFVGVVLFLIAMHRLAKFYRDPAIYKNTLYGFASSVMATVAGIALEIAYFVFGVGSVAVGTPVSFSALMQIMIGFMAFLLLVFVLGIISSLFYMRAFNSLGDRSGLDNFRTAGLLLLIGTVLTIVFAGVFLVWIAWIFAAMGFLALKRKMQTYPSEPLYPSPTTTEQARYCPYCGTRNSLSSKYCQQCGKEFP